MDESFIYDMGNIVDTPVYETNPYNNALSENLKFIRDNISDGEIMEKVGTYLSSLINIDNTMTDDECIIYHVVKDSISIDSDTNGVDFCVLSHITEEIINVRIYIDNNKPSIYMACSTLLQVNNGSLQKNSNEFYSIMYLKSIIFYVFAMFNFKNCEGE